MKRNGFQVMIKLIGLVKPLMGYMILAVLMGLVGHLCASFITIFGGFGVLAMLGFQTPVSLTGIFISVLIFAVLRGFLRYAEQSCNHFIAFKLLALIRDKVFCALRRLCPAKLEGKDKGNLIQIITSDIELLEVFYAHTISPVLIAFLFSVIMCLFIGKYHVLLGLIALAAYVTVGVLIPLVISKLSADTGICFRNRSGELSAFVLDSLRGLSEILQYGNGEKRLDEMSRMTESLSGIEKKMKKMTAFNTAVTNGVILLFDLGMLFASADLMQKGVLDFSGVLISTIALMSSFGPVVALANLGSTLQNTFAAGNRVLDILEETPLAEEIAGQKTLEFDGAAMEHITFAYEDEVILNDVSMEIPRGKILGITGKSGCGKSTLLKLLMRFWKVSEGSVRISGTDIESINTVNLRDMESFMTQETHLFHDSIKNNLRIAKADATDEEMMEACKKASIHEFIMSLPAGYDSQVGELGDTLSGGERQRLGLARVFLHDAPLILLDEPTSNLDSLNEGVILRSLKEANADKTVVLVSHRQSTMKIADVICSMEQKNKAGRVS